MKILILPRDLDKLSKESVIYLGGQEALDILEKVTGYSNTHHDGDLYVERIHLPFFDNTNIFQVRTDGKLERSYHVLEIPITETLCEIAS